jgi:outer membrane protein OmpA-like peptidoglycan-associated protein
MKVRLTGHADAIASHDYNDPLSMERAVSARDYLMKEQDIPAYRLEISGKGKRDPAAPNKTPEGRQKNRRVVFHFFK